MSTKYKFKTKPYRHQVAAIKAALPQLLETGGFALLMEPRTGKTKTAIDLASILHQRGEVARIVVICPLSVIDVWINEIRTHCPFRRRITIWDKDGRKELELPRWGQDVMDFLIINYDAFSSPGAITARASNGIVKRSKTRGGRFQVRNDILKWQPHLIILDESHRIKSPSARKTGMIWSLAYHPQTNEVRTPFRLILTGTVLTKKKRIFDIYSQWKFVNRGSPMVKGRTLKDFKEAYSVWTTRNGYPQWLRNLREPMNELRAYLHREAFAITREECLDLPPAFPDVIHRIPLEESAPYYDQMAEEMVAMLEGGEFTWAKIPLVQRLRLQQITSGVAKTEPTEQYPEGRLVRIGSEKLRFLEDILVDLIEEEEKVVIGARFHGDIQGIQALCQKLKVPCYELSGRVKREQRTQNIADFQTKPGPSVFVAQPAAGSLGIDLSSAATLIWYSLIDSWEQFRQFTDRVALSPRAVRYIYLLAEGTIDEVKYQVLQEDGDMATTVTKSPNVLLRNFKNKKIA